MKEEKTQLELNLEEQADFQKYINNLIDELPEIKDDLDAAHLLLACMDSLVEGVGAENLQQYIREHVGVLYAYGKLCIHKRAEDEDATWSSIHEGVIKSLRHAYKEGVKSESTTN